MEKNNIDTWAQEQPLKAQYMLLGVFEHLRVNTNARMKIWLSIGIFSIISLFTYHSFNFLTTALPKISSYVELWSILIGTLTACLVILYGALLHEACKTIKNKKKFQERLMNGYKGYLHKNNLKKEEHPSFKNYFIGFIHLLENSEDFIVEVNFLLISTIYTPMFFIILFPYFNEINWIFTLSIAIISSFVAALLISIIVVIMYELIQFFRIDLKHHNALGAKTKYKSITLLSKND